MAVKGDVPSNCEPMNFFFRLRISRARNARDIFIKEIPSTKDTTPSYSVHPFFFKTLLFKISENWITNSRNLKWECSFIPFVALNVIKFGMKFNSALLRPGAYVSQCSEFKEGSSSQN